MWNLQQLQILDGLGIAAWVRRDQSLSDWVVDIANNGLSFESLTPTAAASEPATPSQAAQHIAQTSTSPLADTVDRRSQQPARSDARSTVLTSNIRPMFIDDRRNRIAALDWADLQNDVAQCKACQLCNSRTQTVFGKISSARSFFWRTSRSEKGA